MANYILKKQSETTYVVNLTRTQVGHIIQRGNVWNGKISRDGITSNVVGFATPNTAFQAMVLAYKMDRLNKQHGTKLNAFVMGFANEEKEILEYNRKLQEYVDAHNSVTNNGTSLRVVHRRARRW